MARFPTPGLRPLAAFLSDTRGNIAMLTALLMFPLIGVGGLAMDHMQADSAKVRLDNAADAAALAAVNTAKAVQTGNATWGTGDPVAAGSAAAERIFRANARNIGEAVLPTPRISVARVGEEFIATVDWTTTTPATFGRLFGANNHSVAGRAEARSGAALYNDFLIVMDMSASMLIGATDADVQKTYNLLGCAFACHVPVADGHAGETLTALRTNTDAKLRLDVMKDAVISAIEELRRRQVMPNQYRFGIYGFSSETRVYLDISDPRSSDYDAVIAAVRAADAWTTIGGGTIYSRLFPWLEPRFKAGGDGTVTRPLQRMILISDGVENNRQYIPSGTLTYPAAPTISPSFYEIGLLNPALCEPIKRMGVDIATVQVKYVVPTRVPGVVVDGGAWWMFNWISDFLLPAMPTTMGACATSPASHAHADTPAEIYAAISGAFTKSRTTAITR